MVLSTDDALVHLADPGCDTTLCGLLVGSPPQAGDNIPLCERCIALDKPSRQVNS